MRLPSTRRPLQEGPSWLRSRRTVEAPVLLAALPPEVPFGFLGRVAPTSQDLRVDLEVHPVPAGEALTMLQASEAVARAELIRGEGGEGGRTAQLTLEAESASEFSRAVAGRRQELYRIGISLRARGSTRLGAERARSGLLRRLGALGFRTRYPRYETRETLRAPRCTGTDPRPPGYWHTLSTDGVAAFFPFVDESVLEPGGILVGLSLDDASPVVLHRWEHASHSWGVFGATGAGKSFSAALWALRSRWRLPDLELYILDPLGEFGGLAERLGGATVSIGPGATGHWNPLDPATAGGDRAEKAGRVGMLLRTLFPSLRDEEVAGLDAALARLFARGPAVPTFRDLREELAQCGTPPGRLLELLEVFRSGSLQYLDGPSGIPGNSNPTIFDLSGVPEGQRAFHLTYVLDGLYDRLRRGSTPKLVVVDEAHLLARTPGTAEFLDRLVRHVRHYRTGLLLLSQSPDDFLAHAAGRSLLRNLRATMFLRLAHVSDEAKDFFDLTEAEVEWLPRARLPREAGYSEGLLRFGTAHLPIAVAASTPEFEFLRDALRPPRDSDPVPVERHV
ncbi:MAG: DUF87 domain-containing protein [Thermoplasmata archaeon]|nr:DUF87 domain-containing protein [Thermoplasmata archaeon]